MNTTYFIDFDGTITTLDTTWAMMSAFVREADYPAVRAINASWEKKELSTRERANRTFQYFNADMEDMLELLGTIEIDTGFPLFLEHCARAGDRVCVLSDGFDLSIRTVFEKYGIEIPFYCNTMVYDNGFSIVCPHENTLCGHCGVCKTSLVHRMKDPLHRCIYIGDGYSDVCPAGHADVVFAKEPLYSLCRDRGVEAVPFRSFGELIESLYQGPLERRE